MSLWLTRPADDSAIMADALAERGIASIIAPVMRIVPQLFMPPVTLPDALLCTSRHAALGLDVLGDAWRDLPVYSVGPGTSAMLKRSGFNEIITGTGASRSLLPRIINSGHRHLLHLSGAHVREDLTAPLQRHQIHLQKLVVYRAAPVEALPAPFLAALTQGKVTGAVFYSPRSVTLAHALLEQEGHLAAVSRLTLYCLSHAIAEAAGDFVAPLRIAPQPTHHAMMELLSEAAITPP